MEQWAILSGIEGNLGAYEAVLADIRRQRFPVSDVYVLGDFVGFKGDNEAVIRRLQSPGAGELEPQICIGWWEEQCFNLYGLGSLPDAPELVDQEGPMQFSVSGNRSPGSPYSGCDRSTLDFTN